MKEFNLGWGNAVAVRHAFLSCVFSKAVFFNLNDANLSYTDHDGNPTLIDITRKVIERQLGTSYRHILLTNGATGGVTIALRAYAQQGYEEAVTRLPPFFPIYPAMIKSAGLKHRYIVGYKSCSKPVVLIDSPSNPGGHVMGENVALRFPIIHDAVYYSKVYLSGPFHYPITSNVVIGSYSKLLGLNGLRTGWIATNDDMLYIRLKELVEAEYCGLSSASDAVLLAVLKDHRSKTFWDNFETRAKKNLDDNREQWTKVQKFFGNEEVSPNGMFYYAPIDEACKGLLNRSGIVWTSGSSLGTDDDSGRFNLGQDCKLVRDAVKTILKNDRI